MDYDIGIRLDRIEQKMDMIIKKLYPDLFKEWKWNIANPAKSNIILDIGYAWNAGNQ